MSERKKLSNLEYLRVISCLFVIMLHVWGGIRHDISGINLWVCNAVNSICNIGVSCFILISGYFGVRLNWKKIVRLFVVVTGYSVLSYLLNVAVGNSSFGIATAVKAFFPILLNQNWYICCYIALMILSPFINDYLDSISLKKHGSLCAALLLIFSVVPTVFYYELPGTSSKGLWHFILLYVIGRLIRRENRFKELKPWKAGISFAVSAGVTIFLNGLLLLFTGQGKNYYGRDCSLFIVLSAIFFFLLFLNLEAKGSFIEKISKYSLDIYLIHDALVIKMLNRYVFHLEAYYDKVSLTFITLLEVLVCFALSFGLAKVLNPIWNAIGKVAEKGISLVLRKIKRTIGGYDV